MAMEVAVVSPSVPGQMRVSLACEWRRAGAGAAAAAQAALIDGNPGAWAPEDGARAAFVMRWRDGTIVTSTCRGSRGPGVLGGWRPVGDERLSAVFGGLLLRGGRCADLSGRRRVFMVSLGMFVCSSLLCALAWSPAALIGARVLQGVSGHITGGADSCAVGPRAGGRCRRTPRRTGPPIQQRRDLLGACRT